MAAWGPGGTSPAGGSGGAPRQDEERLRAPKEPRGRRRMKRQDLSSPGRWLPGPGHGGLDSTKQLLKTPSRSHLPTRRGQGSLAVQGRGL